ncbi:MAG: ArsR/SmtB family transcription factor [Gulosibacter sp.]|uniref:ArsR/SmtB family transcription factor n=1 Tax=Gulosibacter sp. TaxID=2817531 RepID=UPI003F8EB27D
MNTEPGLAEAAQLFKVLGNESRLQLLRLISAAPHTVGSLVEATGMSQPLVSQHLKSLRQAGLALASREGKAVTYTLSDHHVSHIIGDAIAHAQEASTSDAQPD